MPTNPTKSAKIHQDLEERLKETTERYELAAKATSDVIYDLNIATAEVTWNDALYTEYGYGEDEPAGTLEWWTNHIHPDDALRVEHEISALVTSKKQKWQSEYRFQKADGGYVYVRDRAFVLRGADGVPHRIIGSLMDVTKQKQLDRAKDEFLSLVTHQLRTPLTNIRLFSGMLSGGTLGKLSTKQQDYASRINHATDRMLKLVNDILNVSRIELGRINMQPIRTDPNEVIAFHVDELRAVAKKRGSMLYFKPDTTIEPQFVDPVVLGQIIDVLLENAIRYSRTEKGKITITFTRDRGGYVLSVHDNGIGIPAEAQPHIFSRFYRADNAIKHEEAGTGLGLYLIRLMTDTFGGKVWFESTSGKGTTFFVHIPSAGMEVKQTS